ncbi:MAG: hypothetical protein AVDCRST_MAG55-669 [uncultured Rubrobacteraceae bacterium]|uniref:Uncharacterized protein n=1 Tax=uncultured Rubrobacteraceae bacterium TaxID=349277 RepID=A0A6J4NYT0_9ACTN|nr:MAG: hypothetical protein AVDCRST_MAG55-669 [uncultured Rubrobacteraceae bacterium]
MEAAPVSENAQKLSTRDGLRTLLDGRRPLLGAVFLGGYAWSTFAPGSFGTALFLGTGAVLFAISVPWSSSFHRTFALASFAALAAAVLSGRFVVGDFLDGMPTYFGIVAVLLVLSIAGYPIRAARYEAQIRALVAALTRRGVGIKATSGVLGHVLGAVLDVGAFVLIDVITGRAAPKARHDALKWAGRAFSFAPLWTNLNVFTATTIVLTGVSYPNLLAATVPFIVLGLAGTVLAAQREEGDTTDVPGAPLDRGAAAVLLYPVVLVAAVALVNLLFPGLTLTAAIAVTVAVIVLLIAALATALTHRTSPLIRLADETRGSLSSSHSEFALFGSAGILVISLQAVGALNPVGDVLSSLPTVLVAPALMALMAAGFLAGIHVIPMVLLLDAAFPLEAGPAPVLWAVAVLLGAQATLLLTPFSSAVTMLSRLTGLHPLEVGPKRNWRFGLTVALASAAYLSLLSFLLL